MATYRIKYANGSEIFGVIDDDADAIQKLVRTGDMAKGRPTAPRRAAAAPRQEQATLHAMARAKDAIEAIKVAERSGDRVTLQRAKVDGMLAQAVLKTASDHEKALGAVREAMAKPMRIA